MTWWRSPSAAPVPAGPQPAAPELRPAQPVGAAAIEIERTADRDGVIRVDGQRVSLGAPLAGNPSRRAADRR